jgi:hypothetical protein
MRQRRGVGRRPTRPRLAGTLQDKRPFPGAPLHGVPRLGNVLGWWLGEVLSRRDGDVALGGHPRTAQGLVPSGAAGGFLARLFRGLAHQKGRGTSSRRAPDGDALREGGRSKSAQAGRAWGLPGGTLARWREAATRALRSRGGQPSWHKPGGVGA